MNAKEVLKQCSSAGIRLQFTLDVIQYHAPAGSLTPDLKAGLKEVKAELLDQFNERAGILEYDAGMDRAEAERRAAMEILEEGCR